MYRRRGTCSLSELYHGSFVALSQLTHESLMAFSWLSHGPLMAPSWPSHGSHGPLIAYVGVERAARPVFDSGVEHRPLRKYRRGRRGLL
jgi:hypothetical protein